MSLPANLQNYQKKALEFLKRGCVQHIEFSGSTYQIEVVDPDTKQASWTFIQLDPRGQIKDCFCSCEDSELDSDGCVHLAVAFLRIYKVSASPLHQRFERSPWNKLCRLYADRMGSDPAVLLQMTAQGSYKCNSSGGRLVFFVKALKAKTISKLKEIIETRREETEETSIKFSNLSQEELTLWREGKPSLQLQYELSFWNDLAKWLFLLQDEDQPYSITFEYSNQKIPNHLFIDFTEIEAGFYLSEANLPLIIPSLAYVKSPLKVHNAPQETIESITYDKVGGVMHIEFKESAPKQDLAKKSGISLNGWVFVPDDGFYLQDKHSLFRKSELKDKQIAEVLNDYTPTLKAFLKDIEIHEDTLHVSYAIAFDAEWNLHINAFLFSPGDLVQGYSRRFGNWIYLDDEGFYRFEQMPFESLETVIATDRVADFIHQHRVWLNTHEGFETHVAGLEAQITYHLSDDDHLTFDRTIAKDDFTAKTKEFGSWIYVSGQGFYAKVTSQSPFPLKPGMSLSREQLPLFIRMNKEELQLIPGFFCRESPLAKSGLNIDYDGDDHISIKPVYEVDAKYQQHKVRFFDDYIYIEAQGFYEIPTEQRLPERFRFPVIIDKENLALFLTFELVALRRYAIKIDPRLVKPDTLRLVTTQVSKAQESGGRRYSLKLKYQTERGAVPVSHIWQAISQKKRFLFHEAGLFDLEENRFNWIRLLNKSQVDKRSHSVELSTVELVRLNAFEEIELEKSRGSDYTESRNNLEELLQFKIVEDPDLKGLNCSLRPYQVIGIRWLWFLYQHGLSGLLCDDMGLGKTHQTMALIAAIRNQYQSSEKKPLHFLVICPTSVIYHWQEKIEKFLPGVRVCTFHGISRSLQDFHHQYDVLLTSYGIWRNEIELLSQVNFELAIFDEIQVAKNHTSRIYSSLQSVRARMSLGLTGTPIENHLRELKALFDIVLPSYMPTEMDYREFFVKPIEKEGNRDRRRLLSRLIKPFIMRRKKGDVLLDLPEKIEEISHCELSPQQEQLYNDVLKQSRQKILDELDQNDNSIPFIHIFALLTSLKQVCNHPAVYYKTPEKYKEYTSGKWDLFVELLNEARESRQKVVVFSQYLHMLDIFEEYLKESGVGFATIRGSTQDRAQQLQRFNHDPDCEVFIGSLQATGLGVDLTAGSVVIHYDRWWNAARENQATDRVHRIGQTRGVQVFKLVTIGTFEERIDALIAKKGQLMEDIVAVDDHQIVKKLSRDEIVQLLQYVSKSPE